MQPLTPPQLALVFSASILVADVIWRFVQRKLERNPPPFPPGPTQIPLLGSILSINREQPWKTYTEWHAIYGDIFYLRLLDQDVVVLGSRSVAVELLEKRSHLYSDRPCIATLKPYALDHLFAFDPYSDQWRSCRRIVHQIYRPNGALILRPMQLRKSRQLVMSMIEYPDRYEHHYVLFSIAMPLSTVYDYEVTGPDDPLLQIYKDFSAVAMPAATAENAVLLRLFPFLLHVPDWLPGSWLKREARRARDLCEKLEEIPYQHVEERMRAFDGGPIDSMISYHMRRMQEYPEQSRGAEFVSTLKKAGISTTFASSDTTVSSLMVFTLAMVLNPHVWKRAQAEIDGVVGTDRLPDFGDRSALPYVNGIVRETLRWCPSVPLCVSHATTNSDVYRGRYIPKGATVVPNAWAMSRDEGRFPNAEDFVPERFLDEQGELNENDPMDFVFGFGRRTCPGRYAVDGSLFASVATMLATLDFWAIKDAEGNDLPLEVKWANGVTHHPASFPCRISPRAHVSKASLERMLAERN